MRISRFLWLSFGFSAMVFLMGGCTLFQEAFTLDQQKGVAFTSEKNIYLWPMQDVYAITDDDKKDGKKKKEEKEAEDCGRNLTAVEAREKAKELMDKDDDVQQLQALLKRRGKLLDFTKAKGCEVEDKEKKNKHKEQDNGASRVYTLQTNMTDTGAVIGSLVEIPAGSDAALYISEVGGETESWASIKVADTTEEHLIHIETVVPDTGGPLAAGGLPTVETSWSLPDATMTTALVGELQAEVVQTASNTLGGLAAINRYTDIDTEFQLFVEQASAPGLDWSQAEVIVDEANEELVMVIPEAGATLGTQSLWPGVTSFAFTRGVVVRAPVSRVTVPSRPKPVWRVRRTVTQRPIIHRVVTMQALPKPFELCPYKYYGRITRFNSVLCQGAWNQWYKKQWANGNTTESTIKTAYHQAIQNDVFVNTYVSNRINSMKVMYSGFNNINKVQIQDNLNAIKTRQNSRILDPTFVARFDQARAVFQTIDSTQLSTWFDTLNQAFQTGQFDTEYARLLPLGLNKYVEGVSILTGGVPDTQIKSMLKQTLPALSQPLPEMPIELQTVLKSSTQRNYLAEIFAIQTNLRENLVLALSPLEALYYGAGLVLGQALTFLGELSAVNNGQPLSPVSLANSLLDKWNAILLILSIEGGYTSDQLLEFSENLAIAIRGLFPKPVFSDLLPLTTNPNDYIDLAEAWGMLNWVASGPGVIDRNNRANQVFGSVKVVANSISQGNWVFNGFMPNVFSPTRDPEPWWGGILKYQGSSNGEILTITRGDNCGKICPSANIVEWTARAIEIASNPSFEDNLVVRDALLKTDGLSIVSLVFTKPNADIDLTLQRLQGDSRITNSAIPVLISWIEDKGGNTPGKIWYKCLGSSCDRLSPTDAQAIACNQQGRVQTCGAEFYQPTIYVPPQDKKEPVVIGSPPPTTKVCFSGTCFTESGIFKL